MNHFVTTGAPNNARYRKVKLMGNEASRTTGARQRLITSALLCVGITFLFCANWTNRLHVEGASGWGWGLVLISECLNLTAFSACAALHRRLESALGPFARGGMSLTLGVAATAGRALSIAAIHLTSALAVVGVALYSICEPVLLLGFVVTCCRTEPRRIRFILPASLMAAGALMSVVYMAPSCVGDTIVALCPVLSAASFLVLARARRRCGKSSAPAREDAAARPDFASDGAPVPAPRSHPLPWWPFVLMVAYDFVFHVVACLDVSSGPLTALGMGAIASIALVAALAFSRDDSYSPLFLFKIATPLAVAGLMLVIVSEGSPGPAALLINSGSAAFYLFLLITFAALCQRREYDATMSFALLFAAEHLGHVLGTAAGVAIVGAQASGGAWAASWLAVMTVALVTITMVLADDHEVYLLFGLVPQGPSGRRTAGRDGVGFGESAPAMSARDRVAWASAQAARRYGLTIREEQVFELMLDGLTNQQIAEEIVVSLGTVKSHVSHICRKMGADSREAVVRMGEGISGPRS